MRCKKYLIPLVYVFLNFFIVTVFGQSYNVEALDALVESVANENSMASGMLGVAVFDVNSQQQIYGFNEEKLLTPASILKLVTTNVALSQFGPDHQFKTSLGYNGSIENGTLFGDLVIKGFGDPTFCTDRFGEKYSYKSILKKITESLISKQINLIKGDIVIDASYYSTQLISPKWLWEDIGNYYGAGVGGFNFNENKYDIYFKSGREGTETEIVQTKPAFLNVELINEVFAGAPGSGDNAYVFGAPLLKKQYVRGSISPFEDQFKIKAALPNPALTFAMLLKDHLSKTGIFCKGEALGHYSNKEGVHFKQIITQFYSPALIEIIGKTHEKSINLYAEAILKLLSATCGTNNSTGNSLTTIDSYLTNQNFQPNEYVIYDGSGLSPLNKVSAHFMAKLLSQTAQEPHFEAFYETLSIAGDKENGGYLKNMLQGTIAANNLRAKSGYMTGARSYTGYVTNKSKKLLTFTVIANNYTCNNTEMKSLLEQILLKVAEIE